ncbi:MAG TPA: DnaJ domain-containing protein [Polyangiaceae bacterium]|nr:DnaJ domain-containing protein [Polyangiaceae bacterium]
MLAAKRTSSGSFAQAPLLNLVVLALDRKLSGTLVINDPAAGKAEISLRHGTVSNLRTASSVARLGDVLVSLCGVREPSIEKAVGTASGPKLLGQKLVQAGVIDEVTLQGALREQLLRRITWVGNLPPAASFDYYADVDLLGEWGDGPIAIDPLVVIWQCVKVSASAREMEATLARLSQRELKLHRRSSIERFWFGSELYRALESLRVKSQPLAEFLEAHSVDRELLKRALYALAITRHLDLGREDQEPMGVQAGSATYPIAQHQEAHPHKSSAPPVEAQRSATPRPFNPALVQELQELLSKIDSITHYEALGVATDATMGTIQDAFLKSARKWHPDMWRSGQPEASRDAARVFSHLKEAHDVLIDKDKRSEYDKNRTSRLAEAAEQEQVRQILQAAGQFHKAQIMAKRHDFAAAEALAREAFDIDPTQLEYGAFYAWVAAQNPQRKEKGFEELLVLLNRAIDDNKDSAQLRFYRATVLKRAGRINEAIKDFSFVCENDPHNFEARSELRVFKMRSLTPREQPAAKLSGTFLNKLLKK